MPPETEQLFVDQLIELVKSHPCLYNHNNPHNKHTPTKAAAWKEISKVCGQPIERCLARWKSLRDRYLREYKTCLVTKKTSKWGYFKAMGFIDKFLKINKPNGTPKPSFIKRLTGSNDNLADTMEYDQEQEYSNNSSFNNYIHESHEISSPSSFNPENHHHLAEKTQTASKSNGNDMLDEPEIEIDVLGIANRFNETIKTYKEVSTLRLKRTEDENFGALVADMLSTLTVERRTRAKAHLMQYLADAHLQQIIQ